MSVILCMWTNTVWQLGRYILTVLKQNFVSIPAYLPGSKLSHMWDFFSSCLLFSQLNNELKAKLYFVSSLCGFHFLAFQVLGGFMITSQGTSIMHLKPASEEILCWNLISCMYRSYLSLLLLFTWKLCVMVFDVQQPVQYLHFQRYTELTHLCLPDAFPTWRYKGCPSLLLCSFSIWKRQMLSLPLLTF